MFGSTRRPGMRGTNSLNMGAYYGYGSDQLIVSPAVAVPVQTPSQATPTKIGLGVIAAVLAVFWLTHRDPR